MGVVVSKSKSSCLLSDPLCLFTVLLRQEGMMAKLKGDKRILLRQETGTGSRLEDSTGGIPLLMLSSPSLSPGHLSSAGVHALSIPDPHPDHIW